MSSAARRQGLAAFRLMYAGPGGNRGEFSAWDPIEAKTVWSVKEIFPAWSGTVVTAGDIVLYGTMDGWFTREHDAMDRKSTCRGS
jgi:glucose dehydrogenase